MLLRIESNYRQIERDMIVYFLHAAPNTLQIIAFEFELNFSAAYIHQCTLFEQTWGHECFEHVVVDSLAVCFELVDSLDDDLGEDLTQFNAEQLMRPVLGLNGGQLVIILEEESKPLERNIHALFADGERRKQLFPHHILLVRQVNGRGLDGG